MISSWLLNNSTMDKLELLENFKKIYNLFCMCVQSPSTKLLNMIIKSSIFHSKKVMAENVMTIKKDIYILCIMMIILYGWSSEWLLQIPEHKCKNYHNFICLYKILLAHALDWMYDRIQIKYVKIQYLLTQTVLY